MQRQSVGLSHWKVADVDNILALAITSKSPLYPQPRPTRCSIGARKQSAAAGGLPFFWLSTAISCSRLVHSIHVMIIGNSLGSARARKRSYMHHRGCAPVSPFLRDFFGELAAVDEAKREFMRSDA
jgi:hypothetical protein